MWFDNLKEKNVWEIFESISQIPRESGNEEGIRQYLLNFAKERDLQAVTDKIGNVIIYSPATKGREKDDIICLQGHMDMVCVKTEESSHDFSTDAIQIETDGKIIKAKDTSLGADNGIAIAYALAVIDDKELSHGPLEALFTVNEEVGLTGAFELDPNKIKARKLLNLDSEDEGVIFIGCAGGIEIEAKLKVKMKEVKPKYISYTLSIDGLLGGHSGGEIHKERANAIKLISRIMNRFPSFMISDLYGGTRRNVIPSSAKIVFSVKRKNKMIVESLFQQVKMEILNEYKTQDVNINIVLEKNEEREERAISKKKSRKWINSLYLTICGVVSHSQTVSGIVETSNNLAIVYFDKEKEELSATCSTRSLIDSARDEAAYRVAAAFETCKAQVIFEEAYPSWEPNNESELKNEVAKAYEEFANEKPIITCIHAGLECGVINSKIKAMDSVSIGPNVRDVHSINEYIQVESAERFYNFLKFYLSK